jgi:hypothetical protein
MFFLPSFPSDSGLIFLFCEDQPAVRISSGLLCRGSDPAVLTVPAFSEITGSEPARMLWDEVHGVMQGKKIIQTVRQESPG